MQIKAESSARVQAPDIDSDLFVEVLGILVNVDVPSCDWTSLTAKHDLLNLLAGQNLLLSCPCALMPVGVCELHAMQCACCACCARLYYQCCC